ncbi:MAG: hypothetical protein LBG58_14055, partial [Planctomycetaceae bacterium]|nr:hypothetical protein [Planctomycetaceae bacterium]
NAVVDLVFPFPSAHRVKSAHQVGDLSPKGRVGDSRLAPVSRWQSVSKPVRNTNCPIEPDSLLPIGNATVGESPSAKGCLPSNDQSTE